MSIDINRVIDVLTADPLGKALWDRAQLAVQLQDTQRALEASEAKDS